jgi:hypothetical protein
MPPRGTAAPSKAISAATIGFGVTHQGFPLEGVKKEGASCSIYTSNKGTLAVGATVDDSGRAAAMFNFRAPGQIGPRADQRRPLTRRSQKGLAACPHCPPCLRWDGRRHHRRRRQQPWGSDLGSFLGFEWEPPGPLEGERLGRRLGSCPCAFRWHIVH